MNTTTHSRLAIVTGGASGIGAATVERLHGEGANVVAVDLSKDKAQEVVDRVGAGARLLAVGTDVADAGQVDAMMEACVSRFGVPDGLANCAGIRGVGSILDTDDELFRRNMEVNVTGSFNTSRAFARLVTGAGRNGAIVNISSTAGTLGINNRLAYVTAKHGVIGLTRAAALDLASAGIRVNVITPGMTRTPMTAPMFVEEDNVERIRAAQPIGREGRPEEIAAAIAFLLSDDASFIVGAILPVDGGGSVGQSSH